MHHTADAGYRSGNRQGCLRGTRKDILLQLERWLKDEQDHRVFWLNGLAGTGKSTIAQTFAEISFADGDLGASFFCSRDFEDRSNLQAIFPTLAFKLAYRYPLFREQLLQVLRANPDIRHESLCSQLENIVIGPFKATQISTLIIIDALDECKDEEPASAILSVLSRYVDEIPRVKFFITGRPEPRIRSGFRLESLRPITEVLRLHDVERSLVNGDIRLFFRTQLTEFAKTRSDCELIGDWPSLDDIGVLCEKAAGLFIYASTVIKFIMSKHSTPTERLNVITSLPQSTAHEGKLGIDQLYTQVLEQAFCDVDLDEHKLYSHFRSVVGMVLLVFNPLPIRMLSTLLRIHNISITLRSLHSVLLIPDSDADPIRVFHKSFPDFLLDSGRCKDTRFFIDPSVHHQEILLSCLSLIKERSKRNVYDLDDSTPFNTAEDPPTHCKTQIGDALVYACQFWAKHLARIPSSGHDVEKVHEAIDKFFTTCLLFWIEVLSLTNNLGASLYAIKDIQQWYISVSSEWPTPLSLYLCSFQAGLVCKWADDSQRFILEYFDVIHDSPSKIYCHALPFIPSKSWLRECYSSELSQVVKVVKGLQTQWGAYSRTVSIECITRGLTCWRDFIAVGYSHNNILILNAITGMRTSVLSGHTHGVHALAFSLDGTFLVSGSNDTTVKLWDVQTGGVVKTFYGHIHGICCVSISPDCTTIASGSGDHTINLWDTLTGKCCCVIKEHMHEATSISFSPSNSQLLMSASYDNTIRQWDINGHQIGPAYDGNNAAFSPDGALFVLGGEVTTVRNSDSGAVVAKLQVPGKWFKHCCFSPDGKFMAGVEHYTIYVWEITSPDPHLVGTFIGHTDYILSLIFSSSLISSSRDGSIKFWHINTTSTDPVATDSESTPLTLASIVSVSLQVNSGIVISSDLAGMVKTWDILTGHCRASFATPPGCSGEREVQLINDRLIIVWFGGYKIHIWNTEKGELLHTVGVSHSYQNVDFRISGDESMVILRNGKDIQFWSVWTGEILGEVRLEHEPPPGSLSVDGSRVWVHFEDSQIQEWDFGIPGSSPIPLPNTSIDRPHLSFIGTKQWNASLCRVKDVVTGEEIFQMPGRYTKFSVTQWDGRYLVAGYPSGEVLILDFNQIIP